MAGVLSCPGACGILLDQGLNLCPLHWQDSQPMDPVKSPTYNFYICGNVGFHVKLLCSQPLKQEWQYFCNVGHLRSTDQ